MKSSLICAFALLLSFNLISTEWPQFMGPNANGRSKEKDINKNWKKKPPKVLWKVLLTDQGHSTPSIANGKVFVLDHKIDKDIVRAFNLKSGEELWKYKYKDADKQKWGFTRTAPLYNKGKLYTLSRNGKVICLDAGKGTLIWELDFQKEFGVKPPRWGFTSSPIIDDDKLILCPLAEGAMIIAVKPDTGKILWKGGGTINAGYSTPTIQKINGEKQYVLANKFGLAGISTADGKVLWATPFKTKYGNNIACPIVFDNNKVFMTAGYNHGSALFKIEKNKVEKIYENENLQCQFNSPVMVDGIVYGIGKRKALICMDPKNGKVLWTQMGFGQGGLIEVDGVLIALDGAIAAVKMIALNKEKYEELGVIRPLSKDKQSWVPPVISDKKLIVRNRTEMVCLDLAP